MDSLDAHRPCTIQIPTVCKSRGQKWEALSHETTSRPHQCSSYSYALQ